MPAKDGNRLLKEKSVDEKILNIDPDPIDLDTAVDEKIVNVATLNAELEGRDIAEFEHHQAFKAKVATTAHIDLTATVSTIDGVTLLDGDIVLVHKQSDPKDNQLAFWSSGTSKLTTLPSYTERYGKVSTLNGTQVFVEQGQTYASRIFTLYSEETKPEIGLHNITFLTGPFYYGWGGVRLLPNNTFEIKIHPTLGTAFVQTVNGLGLDPSKLPGYGSGQTTKIYILSDTVTGDDSSIQSQALTKSFELHVPDIEHDATILIAAPTEVDPLAFEQPSNISIDVATDMVSFDLVKIIGLAAGTYETRVLVKNGQNTAWDATDDPTNVVNQFYSFLHVVNPDLPFVINSVTVDTVNWQQGQSRLVTVSLYTNVAITNPYQILDLGADFEQDGAIITNNPATGALSFNIRPVGTFPANAVRNFSFKVRSMPYVTALYSQNITINRLPFEIDTVAVDAVDWVAGQTRQVSVSLYANAEITTPYTLVGFGADFTLGTIITNNPATGTLVFNVTPVGSSAVKNLTFNVASGIYQTTDAHNQDIYVYHGVANNVQLVSTGGFFETAPFLERNTAGGYSRNWLGTDLVKLVKNNNFSGFSSVEFRMPAARTNARIDPNSPKDSYIQFTIGDDVLNLSGAPSSEPNSYYDFWIGLIADPDYEPDYSPFPHNNPGAFSHYVRIINTNTATDTTFLNAQFFDTNGSVGAVWNVKNGTFRIYASGGSVRVTDGTGADINGISRISLVPATNLLYCGLGARGWRDGISWYASLVDIQEGRIDGAWG